MSPTTSHNTALIEQAARLMPGGVNSPVRSFKQVGGQPRFIREAAGCRMTDVDGRSYIDYVCSWGPLILGHAHPDVVKAVQAAAERGTSYGAPCGAEVELAAEIVERVPTVEQVRLVNSGTEAVMSALRLARASTGRERILKFSGCYHGHVDALLCRAGSGVATLGLPDSPGVPAAVTANTIVLPYNHTAALQAAFAEHGDALAAAIVEPVAGNMGVVPPAEGFLQRLRALTRSHGALLIFDEVMTGFRVAPGGAQQHYGVAPDITTLGKIIGGGCPVGAYGGPAALMQQIAPSGPVYQAGTLSGNPLAMAAGLATLRALNDGVYEQLEHRAQRLARGLEQAIERSAVQAVIQRVGSMLSLFFGRGPMQCFEDVNACSHETYARFFHGMLARGVYLPPSGYEAWFVSSAHDEDAIDETIRVSQEALEGLT